MCSQSWFYHSPDSSLLPPAQHHINRLASLSEFRILFTSAACPPALQSALEVLNLRQTNSLHSQLLTRFAIPSSSQRTSSTANKQPLTLNHFPDSGTPPLILFSLLSSHSLLQLRDKSVTSLESQCSGYLTPFISHTFLVL